MTADDIPASERAWEVGGFLDDDMAGTQAFLAAKRVRVPVVGTIRDYEPHGDDRLICAIGTPKTKLAVCEALRERGAEFASLIHPTAQIGPNSSVGAGALFMRFSGCTVDCTIGDFVTVNSVGGAGHDAVLEDGCTLSSHSEASGNTHLERGVFLGSHATVLPWIRVGAFATIGAGSVVLRRVPPGATVFGVPARRLDF